MKIPLNPLFTKGDNYPSLWQSLPAVGRGGWEGFKEVIFKVSMEEEGAE